MQFTTTSSIDNSALDTNPAEDIEIYAFQKLKMWQSHSETLPGPRVTAGIRATFDPNPSWVLEETWPLLTEQKGGHELHNWIDKSVLLFPLSAVALST